MLAHCDACSEGRACLWLRRRLVVGNAGRRRELCFRCAAPMQLLPPREWHGRPVVWCAECEALTAAGTLYRSVCSALEALGRSSCQLCGGAPAELWGLCNDRSAEVLNAQAQARANANGAQRPAGARPTSARPRPAG